MMLYTNSKQYLLLPYTLPLFISPPREMVMKIGKRVRKQCNKLGLTLRELATRTDLTAGFLSQIENDQISS